MKLAALALLVLTGCTRSILASDYDQTCAVDADCAAIEEGDVCYACGATSAAVSRGALDQVLDDRNERNDACVLWDDVEADCFCTGDSIVACESGRCTLAKSNCD